MHFLKSNRLAWSVAAASLALWSVGAPNSWGARIFDQVDNPAVTTSVDVQTTQTSLTSDDSQHDAPACVTPVPPQATGTPSALVAPNPGSSSNPMTATSGTFHICGADAQTAQAIEQLIGGRSFSSSLTSRGDGCADLTINVVPGASTGSASGTSTVSVSLGGGRRVTIKIMSMQGVTHATISED